MADYLQKSINWGDWHFRIPDPEDQKKVIARFRKSGARREDREKKKLEENHPDLFYT